jgi:hypothetical protein
MYFRAINGFADNYRVAFQEKEAAILVAAAQENVNIAFASGKKPREYDMRMNIVGSNMIPRRGYIDMGSGLMFDTASSLSAFEKATPMVIGRQLSGEPKDSEIDLMNERLEQSREARDLAEQILQGVCHILLWEIDHYHGMLDATAAAQAGQLNGELETWLQAEYTGNDGPQNG